MIDAKRLGMTLGASLGIIGGGWFIAWSAGRWVEGIQNRVDSGLVALSNAFTKELQQTNAKLEKVVEALERMDGDNVKEHELRLWIERNRLHYQNLIPWDQ